MSTKKIVQQLKLRKIDLQEHMEAREILYNLAGESWRESEKGQFYDFKNGELAEAIDYLEEDIEALETFHS